MMTKFLLKPFASSSPKFILLHKPSLPKFLISSLSTTATINSSTSCSKQSHCLTQTQLANLNSYGPSLQKGTYKPSQLSVNPLNENPKQLEEEEEDLLDEDSFTRVFDIAALRVPAKDCFTLESRLRGHLLNWPRIRNIARVPGDEVDPELVGLLGDQNGSSTGNGDGEEGSLVSLQRRIYGKAEGDGEVLSPVLYRDELAKTFNSRGFIKFRNLEKISRPKKRKKREEGNGEGNKGIRKNNFAVVEIVEDGEEEVQDLKNLLGDEIKWKKWRGSTRLLLLDEKYAGKGVEELPEAVKAVLKEYAETFTASTFELIRCKLTLFYDYWQMNEILTALLPKGMVVPSAFETVGHIAHLNLRDELLPFKKFIAKVVLDKNKPKIQTVVNKTDMIHNEYRTMQLEILAGNHSLMTTVVENGIRFQVDLATVYWNSRLATEWQRLVTGFTRNDVICDVFSGVGPIAISAAKVVKRVFANDLNPYAVEYLERNTVLNKFERKIEVFNMDGRRFINAMFTSAKARSITQVVMNLPNDAAEFLDAFKGIYSDRPKNREFTFPRIHVYGFSKAQDPEFEFHERIRIALKEVAVNVDMHRVRLVAPGKWMLCASFILPESVAFAKTTLPM
ncbi:tRNA (guanine(37)-N1)-methyltransferase [Quillaja saponaria]|uniref:tRNA (guanine(37)-N1)-methyltransferase n=1 Tax=Quillaja saponaria TaxID=32244 RepID=A0AAD7KZP5_QUISA|nr:tRNA (guanine(37)-N1)-methyltransferase [Quillaja saponaria]